MSLFDFKFSQSLGEFITHKTNKLGAATIVMGAIGYANGFVDYAGLTAAVIGGLGFITIRDGIAKIDK